MTEPSPHPPADEPNWALLTNPYEFPPGPDLDALIHHAILGQGSSPNCPPYSTDSDTIDQARRRIQTALGISIITGRTRLHRKPWFARYQTDASDGTEVLAETYPLAICRLALLKKQKG